MAILMIEDEFLVAEEIRFHLEQAGFTGVQHAATEVGALGAIGSGDWHAAVVDANLNGCGIDRIASALFARRIPFLILTGYGREGLPQSVAGITVLNKPFLPQTLVDTVGRLCAERRA
jgi:DNA-binding response OmpR family regulator